MPGSDERARFAFITNAAFRSTLEADYTELQACTQAQAWKAVHVLAGSIIEALLVDSLVSITPKKEHPRLYKEGLAKLIGEANSAGVVSERAANLSHVVRGYRNLIHPGLSVRNTEIVDAESAIVASALVNMIIAEVVEQRKETYGLTAEQIASKLETDPTAVALLPHFLKDTREIELEQLVLGVLPRRIVDLGEDEHASRAALERAYRVVFDAVDDDIKAAATAEFVRVLREEGQFIVRCRENLFRAVDVRWLGRDDAALVKTHLLTRLRDVDAPFATAATGIGSLLDAQEARRIASALIRTAPLLTNPFLFQALLDFVASEVWNLKGEAKSAFEAPIRSAAERATGGASEEALTALAEALDDIPF